MSKKKDFETMKEVEREEWIKEVSGKLSIFINKELKDEDTRVIAASIVYNLMRIIVNDKIRDIKEKTNFSSWHILTLKAFEASFNRLQVQEFFFNLFGEEKDNE